MMRTDNRAEIGVHVFERAGLGKAPFRVVGCEEKFITYPDGTTQASGSCAYCGTGLRYVFAIRDADGREFGVGCDCVQKSGDAGLIKGYKNAPEYRAMQRDKRAAKAAKDFAEAKDLLSTHAQLFAGIQFGARWDGSPQTALDYYTRVLPMCGAAGCARNLKRMRQLAANPELMPSSGAA